MNRKDLNIPFFIVTEIGKKKRQDKKGDEKNRTEETRYEKNRGMIIACWI